MARRRMIDPNIWQSEDVSKLSVFARYMLIGMISNADDYGKGRASAAFLRSAIFPYDDIRIADIEKALSEISQNISVILYEQADNQYYLFVNWEEWQKVDHPTKSHIPDPPKDAQNAMGERIANHSRNNRESNPPNIINIKELKEDNIYTLVVSFLNERAGTKFRQSSQKTRRLIDARTNEGYTLDDFKTVIQKKCAQWKSDKKMSEYIRPETLFGNKFEGYLNQKVINKQDYDQREYSKEHFEKDQKQSDEVLEEFYE